MCPSKPSSISSKLETPSTSFYTPSRASSASKRFNSSTVGEANWQGTADNQLVQLAQGNFDVLLTLDRGFEFQHNLKKLTFGILILHPARNRREDYEPMAEALRQAVMTVQPGQVLHVYAEE